MKDVKALGVVVALTATIVGGIVVVEAARASAEDVVQAGSFDLIAAESGGRVEWATPETVPVSQVAMNLIADTRNVGWVGRTATVEDMVFSFFGRQAALVASVQIDSFVTAIYADRLKDVEVWTSMKSATEDASFVKAAAATLENKEGLQTIPLTAPVEARFVKLRILNTHPYMPNGKPGAYPVAAKRVKVIEGQRAGYATIVARNPDLASALKGTMPGAPPALAPPPPPSGPATCAAPVEDTPKKSRFSQSRNVLVVTDDTNAFRAVVWKKSEKTVLDWGGTRLPGVEYTWLPSRVVSPAHLLNADTVVFAQVCKLNSLLTPAFKNALLQWVAAGHKVIIQDSDYCGPSDVPDYSFMPFPFATVNPGATGAAGEASILENSTLVSSASNDPAFIDTPKWAAGQNDLGDSNVMVQYDARWCGAIWAINKLKKNGMTLAYARHGRGLVIYDGIDYDQFANPIYRKVVAQELLQPFDPDYLPCSQPLGGFVVTTKPENKSRHIAADRAYTYPIDVLGNYGYSGTVTLEASISPADPAVALKLSSTTADLNKVDRAAVTLSVTAGAAASLRSKVVTVRGRDASGKSNVLCLALPERRTGGISVSSALRKDKPPTKNIEIILDASGSMRALLGKQTRWATAQAVLKDVVSKLPKDFSVGLRAYGHTLASTNPATCKDTALVVPIAPLNPTTFLAAAGKLAPRGETPLVYSILQTPADLKAVGGGTVILITDGEESCKGDFAAAAKALKDAGMNLTLNVVGFTLKSAPAQAALSGLAESTGGHYYTASSGESLARAILLAAVDRLPYRILDAAGKEVARGEAGVNDAHELPPGTYTVIVTAGEQDARFPVTLAIGQDVALRARIQGDKLVVER